MRRRRSVFVLIVLGGLAAGALSTDVDAVALPREHLTSRIGGPLRPDAPLAVRLTAIGPRARLRWKPLFAAAGLPYPPVRAVFVGLKEEKRLEVVAVDAAGRERFVRSIRILAASGGPGPKLREGDRQVPEGLYACTELNPNSTCHVSLRIDYPNADDRAHAEAEGRNRPGGDIMIHGGALSVGCLAVGDDAAEDLFVLAADVGIANVEIVLSPYDVRRESRPRDPPTGAPSWTRVRWDEVFARLRTLPTV
jgi:hypothetical protein